jgi:transposase
MSTASTGPAGVRPAYCRYWPTRALIARAARTGSATTLPDLAEALTGHFDDHHALLVGAMLHRLDHVETALAELDVMIAAAMTPWAHQLELLQTIPGVGLKTAQVIVAETGGDMGQFPTAAQLAAWAGGAPAMHESAGKRRPAGPARATSGWRRCWSRPRARCPDRRPPTWPRSTPRSRPDAAEGGPLSPSRTRCWCPRTTC